MFYVFLEAYCTDLVNELRESNKLIVVPNLNNGNVQTIASAKKVNHNNNQKIITENIFGSNYILDQNNANMKKESSLNLQKKIMPSNSGLIQTISMDLKPDRDNFLPRRALHGSRSTGKKVMDGESKSPNLSSSTLPLMYHDRLAISSDDDIGLIMADYDNEHVHHKHDQDEKGKLASSDSEDGWDKIQWQQRLYSDTIEEKISRQYIL